MSDLAVGRRARAFYPVLAALMAVAWWNTGLAAQETPEQEPAQQQTDDVQANEVQSNLEELTARQFLELLDFGPSYVQMLIDGQPLLEEEQEAILRVLTRIRRMQAHRVTGWLELEVPWSQLAEEPETYRLKVYLLTGLVQEVRPVEIAPEVAEQVGLNRYYEVDLALDAAEGGSEQGTIVVEKIPQAWQAVLDDPEVLAGQPVSCPAIYLKPHETDANQAAYIFATPKLSWHPAEPNETLGVSPAQVVLAGQGMDIAELANIEDRTALGVAEREAFYQMLAAVGRLTGKELDLREPASVSRLLTLPEKGLMVSPETYRAQFLRLAGHCRRITRIEVDDADLQRRLGIDHYYELSIFVPIAAPIVSQRQADAATRKEFEHDYPVLLCVRELPPGLEVGDQLYHQVAATGAFFKLWAYRTPYMSREDFTRRQISPLLIAADVQINETVADPETNDFVVALLLILTLVAVLGIGLGVVLSRRPRRRRR